MITKNSAFGFGVLGVALFVATTILVGFLNPNYNHSSQFISELYAVGAPNADIIRYYFYIPSGVLFLLFALFSNAALPKSGLKTLGFIAIGFGYGIGTILCSIFNCDAGCNPNFVNPTLSQIIHNFMGMITYLVVPAGIFCIAIVSRKWENSKRFSNLSFVLAIVSFVFVLLFNASLNSPFKGLLQRMIEGTILIWILICSGFIRKNIFNKL